MARNPRRRQGHGIQPLAACVPHHAAPRSGRPGVRAGDPAPRWGCHAPLPGSRPLARIWQAAHHQPAPLSCHAGGSQFADLAKQHSICPSGKRGGDLGWITRNSTFPAFDAAAYGARLGEVVRATTERGHHLIRVEEERCAAGRLSGWADSGTQRPAAMSAARRARLLLLAAAGSGRVTAPRGRTRHARLQAASRGAAHVGE